MTNIDKLHFAEQLYLISCKDYLPFVAGWILENYPEAPQTWPIKDYHLLLDKLPHPLVYEAFPCYFFVAVAVSLFSLKMEEGKKDRIPEAQINN